MSNTTEKPEKNGSNKESISSENTTNTKQDMVSKQTKKKPITAAEWVIGISLMILSAILFSFNGVLIKWASDIGYKSMEIFVFRSGMQLFITIIATLFSFDNKLTFKIKISFEKFEQFKNIQKKLIKWIICRGIFAAITGICYFHAITIIPLGDAITVFSTYPIVTAFIAFIFLKEKISIIHCIALLSSVIGVYLIATGTESESHNTATNINKSWFQIYFGYIASIVGALCGGFVFIFIRLSTIQTSPIILVYSHGFFCLLLSFLVGIIFQGFTWNYDQTYYSILIMVCFGLVGYFGQWTMNKSTQLIPAAISSLIRSSDSVFSYIWQVVLFSTIPTIETVIGAICVIIGIFLVSIEKLRHAYAIHNGSKNNINNIPEQTQLNSKRIIIKQYGSINDKSSDIIIDSKGYLSTSKDFVFASNYSLDPNDSHICLIATQD